MDNKDLFLKDVKKGVHTATEIVRERTALQIELLLIFVLWNPTG